MPATAAARVRHSASNGPGRVAATAGAVLSGSAALLLVAWHAGWASVLRTPPGSATVPPVALWALALLGAALVAAGRRPPGARPVSVPAVAAAAAAVIGAVAFLEDLLHTGLGIDRLAGVDRVTLVGPPGRPAPELAVGLLLAGAALAVLSVAPSATRAVVGLSTALATVVVVAAVELAGARPALFRDQRVSLPAMVGLAVLTVAIQLLVAERAGAIHALFVDPSMKSAMLRAFVVPLPLIAAGPIVFVSMWVDAHHTGDGRVVAGAGTATVAALMAASALVGRRLGDRLARPLEEMAAQSRRIAGGDFGTALPSMPEGLSSEFQDLAASFEAMRVRLGDVARQRDDFVAMVAHDLRAPMALIAGAADTLRLRGANLPAHKREEFLFAISRSVGRLARMVDDMLQAASLESGDHTLDIGRCDLGDLLARAAAEGEQTWGRSVGLRLEHGLQPVQADSQRVWQVLSNLLSNAVKFSPDGAGVSITARADGEAVRVEVADHGPGIPPEQQAQIWEKFSRLGSTRRAPGTGLGLYICRELVRAQGGRVGLRSAPGRGSTFWFTLPIAGDEPVPIRTAASPARRSG